VKRIAVLVFLIVFLNGSFAAVGNDKPNGPAANKIKDAITRATDIAGPNISEGNKPTDPNAEKINSIFDRITQNIYSFLPDIKDSFDGSANATSKLPLPTEYSWIFYLIAFLAGLTILSRIWQMIKGASLGLINFLKALTIITSFSNIWEIGKKLFENASIGIFLLLVIIHLLGVQLKVTVLILILTILLGVKGVLFVLVMHYLGIPL
jgi:hypothetical protein